MKLKLFQVDAFAERPFEGNPAAVCPLDRWLDDALLQAIAEENNLSETAFFVPAAISSAGGASPTGEFELRWFTPRVEVDLCGHATLAAAYVLFESLGYRGGTIRFRSRSGPLVVERSPEGLRMDFPVAQPEPCDPPAGLEAALGARPREVLAAFDYLAVFDSEDDVRALSPDFARLAELDRRGVVTTAPAGEPGAGIDFVSRGFFPNVGIDEDPVTGSAHCELAPYWSRRLGKRAVRGRQLSRRGGLVLCEVAGGRVFLTGKAVRYLEGEIVIA